MIESWISINWPFFFYLGRSDKWHTKKAQRTKFNLFFVEVNLRNFSFNGCCLNLYVRMYATRRIKDAFRENKDISDPEKIRTLIKRAEDSLQVMKRQVLVHLFLILYLPFFFYQSYQDQILTLPKQQKKKKRARLDIVWSQFQYVLQVKTKNTCEY